jgi:hypothetical protein
MEVCGQHHNPAVLNPGKELLKPMNRRLWGLYEPVWTVLENRKMLHPPGFETRSVQSVTDYNIWAPHYERCKVFLE